MIKERKKEDQGAEKDDEKQVRAGSYGDGGGTGVDNEGKGKVVPVL